jgi:hypothetical protein
VNVSLCLSVHALVYPSTYTSVGPSFLLFIHSSVHLSVCLSVCLSAWLYGTHIFLKACNSSASQLICQHFVKTEYLLRRSLKLIVPILEYILKVQALQVYLIFNFNSPIYAYVFQVFSFIQISPPQHCTNFCFSPFVLHIFPISFFSIWSNRLSTDQIILFSLESFK